MDVPDYSKSSSLFRIKYELKYLFFGFLLTAAVSTLFIYLIIFLIDIEKTNKYNSLITSVFLAISTSISVLLITTNLKKIEIQKFKAVFIGIFCWFIGEMTYMTYQFILNIPVPYPSIAEIFYLLGYGFLIYHIYVSFKNLYKNRSIKLKSIILVSILVSLIPLISISHMFLNGIDFTSQYIQITINLLYYILDSIILFFVVLIIFRLPKKDHLIYHWLLFCSSMVFLAIADFGYTYAATISINLILITEWLWNVFYAFAYLFLSASLLWYYKVTQLLNKDIDDIFNEEKGKRKSLALQGVGQYKEEIYKYDDDNNDNNKLFRENIEDLSSIQNLTKDLINNAKHEINILFCKPDWLTKRDAQPIINTLKEKIQRDKILIRLLVPISINDNDNNKSLHLSLKENPNVMLRYFEKTLTSDSIILVVDLQKVIVWDTKKDNNNNDDDNNNKYFAIFTNREESVFTYVSSFEETWLLEKVIKCNLD